MQRTKSGARGDLLTSGSLCTLAGAEHPSQVVHPDLSDVKSRTRKSGKVRAASRSGHTGFASSHTSRSLVLFLPHPMGRKVASMTKATVFNWRERTAEVIASELQEGVNHLAVEIFHLRREVEGHLEGVGTLGDATASEAQNASSPQLAGASFPHLKDVLSDATTDLGLKAFPSERRQSDLPGR